MGIIRDDIELHITGVECFGCNCYDCDGSGVDQVWNIECQGDCALYGHNFGNQCLWINYNTMKPWSEYRNIKKLRDAYFAKKNKKE